jgi:F-type H+-transporting ATPase subunit delta
MSSSAAATHDTVLDAGSVRARLAKVYAEAVLAAALPKGAAAVDATGEDLEAFTREVLGRHPDVAAFLASPAVGHKTKEAALAAALDGRASDLLRGLLAVLARNGRLDLVPGIAAAYRQLLEDRAGRVRVKVASAVELSDAQRAALTETLSGMMRQTPVLDARVDPDLLGGLVIQVGDRVIDTSVRTRLQTLRTLLLDRGSSYVVENQG